MDFSLLPVDPARFYTAASTAYTDLSIDNHRETWPICSWRFRGFLRRSYYQATGSAASVAAIKIAFDQLDARAQVDAPNDRSTLASRNMASASTTFKSRAMTGPTERGHAV